jgi:hypothetical protein
VSGIEPKLFSSSASRSRRVSIIPLEEALISLSIIDSTAQALCRTTASTEFCGAVYHIRRITQLGAFHQRRVAELKQFADDRGGACRSSCGRGIDRPRDTAAGNNSSTDLAAPCSARSKNLRIFGALTGSASSKYSSQSLVTSSHGISWEAIAANHAPPWRQRSAQVSRSCIHRAKRLKNSEMKRRVGWREPVHSSHGVTFIY